MPSEIKYKIKKVSDLIPYVNNARTHSDEQVAQIASSIKEFGFVNPVLLGDDNVVIAGHGRLMAARKLRITEVPCMIISGLTEIQRKALVLADNRLAMSAGWDNELLSLELQSLADENYDLSVMGFTDDELAKFIGNQGEEGLCDPNEVGEAPADPITRPGDIWLLGKHRLRCGDSTAEADVKALLNGVEPHLMVTDPPYGVEYDADWRNEPEKLNLRSSNVVKSKTAAIGKVMNDHISDWSKSWKLFPGDVAYVWHGERQSSELVEHMRKAGAFEHRNLIVWAKSSLVISRGHYHPQHETCWYFVRKGKTASWTGDRKQTTLWEIDKPQKSETGHSTQKPVECMKRPMENNSSPGQAVYEPFSGSGTTIIAGEMTGRVIYAMEIMPEYVDMAVERWQKFTGKSATLESNGKSFEELKAAHGKSGTTDTTDA